MMWCGCPNLAQWSGIVTLWHRKKTIYLLVFRSRFYLNFLKYFQLHNLLLEIWSFSDYYLLPPPMYFNTDRFYWHEVCISVFEWKCSTRNLVLSFLKRTWLLVWYIVNIAFFSYLLDIKDANFVLATEWPALWASDWQVLIAFVGWFGLVKAWECRVKEWGLRIVYI